MALAESTVQSKVPITQQELWDRDLRARRPAISDDGFDMPGFVGHYYMWPEEYSLLAKYVALTRGDYLEIGSMCGIIAMSFALGYPNRKFVCVDNFSAGHATIGGNKDAFLQNLRKHELRNVELVEGDSLIVVPELKQRFDIVFVDANHAYEHVLADALNSLRLLSPGGFIAFHDYGCVEQTTQAVREFLRETGSRLVEAASCLAVACKPVHASNDQLPESHEFHALKEQMTTMRTAIEQQDREIARLKEENRTLDDVWQAIQNSASWRLLDSWRRIRGRLAPPATARRKVYDWAMSPLRRGRS